jgi:hypothetical protein
MKWKVMVKIFKGLTIVYEIMVEMCNSSKGGSSYTPEKVGMPQLK